MGLDRIGTFRGIPLEWGVNKTREKGLPQFVVQIQLTEYYDQQENQWFDYSEFDASISAFLCLYGANKKKNGQISPTLTYEQVKKVFDWDGVSFAELANGNYSELQFQLRIGENTYEGAKTPYQVEWIDEYNTDPIRQLQKLNADELKDLDKQFAKYAKKPVKVVTAVKNSQPTKVSAKKTEKTTPISKEEKQKILREKSERIRKETTKAKARITEPPEPPESSESPRTETVPPQDNSCTKQQAWEAIVEMRDPTINDETIKELWNTAIEEVAGPDAMSKKGQKEMTDEQWYKVKEIVLADCAKF